MVSTFNITEASVYDSNIYVQEIISPSEQINYAFENGVTHVCIFLTPQSGQFPRNKPQLLKAELDKHIGPNARLRVKFTRNGKLLLETTDAECARAAAEINNILDIPVTATVQQDSITTRFVVHNIDSSIRLEDLGSEIQTENKIKIKELRRFTRKVNGDVQLTETVLITIFGTNLPREIKMFYMMERIKPFYDRPRQCQNCWQFDHSTGKCKNETLCKKCSKKHEANNCSGDILLCINCQGAHMATDALCSARSQEMKFLKYKSDSHLSITEARRRYTKDSKVKNYAEAVKANESQPINPLYVTKNELEKTMENFVNRTQEMIVQVMQQQTTLFLQAIEGLVSSITAACASSTQNKVSHLGRVKSPPEKTSKSKKTKFSNSVDISKNFTSVDYSNMSTNAHGSVTNFDSEDLGDNMEEF